MVVPFLVKICRKKESVEESSKNRDSKRWRINSESFFVE